MPEVPDRGALLACARALAPGGSVFAPRTLPADPLGRRVAFDIAAMRARFHDPQIFRGTLPKDGNEASLLDEIESLRCLWLGALLYPGICRSAQDTYRASPAISGLFWRMLLGEEASCRALRVTEQTRLALLSAVSAQERFSSLVVPLLRSFPRAGFKARADIASAQQPKEGEGLPADPFDPQGARPLTAEERGWTHSAFREPRRGYTVFDPRDDCVFDPAPFVTDQMYEQYRKRIAAVLDGRRDSIEHLGRRLQRRLQSHRRRCWIANEDEGYPDPARIASWIARPLSPVPRLREVESGLSRAAVTLLLDLSGSMRGAPILNAACCAELLSAVLERCGIGIEILGYTTRFRQEIALARWRERGSPPSPGRLNGLLHVVFRSALMPARRTRRNLAWVLQDVGMCENIDGEALQWAAARLLRQPEDRRVLVVLSDGSPYDGATVLANGRDFLESHLRQVTARLEQIPGFTLMGFGLGRDLNRFFSRCALIRTPEDILPVLTEHVERLLLR